MIRIRALIAWFVVLGWNAPALPVKLPSQRNSPIIGTTLPSIIVPSKQVRDSCVVTLGSAHQVPPSWVDARELPVPWVHNWYGSGKVWFRLPINGVLPALTVQRQGKRELWTTKFPWWRAGRLKITASFLGVGTATFGVHIPTGYSPMGFQPTTLEFGRLGCWRIVASVGASAATFTARVAHEAPYTRE